MIAISDWHDFRPCVDSTAGDVVQLVRTLPCRWLESHTVTAEPQNQLPHRTSITLNRSSCLSRRRSQYHSAARVLDLYRITAASSKFSRGLRGWSLLGSP